MQYMKTRMLKIPALQIVGLMLVRQESTVKYIRHSYGVLQLIVNPGKTEIINLDNLAIVERLTNSS